MTSEAELRSQLSALPSPPMPEAVAQDISRRLADEAHTRAAGAEVIIPIHRRRLGGLLIAAAVAGIAMLLAATVQPSSTPVATAAPVVHAGALYEPALFAEQLTRRFSSAPAAIAPTGSFADSAQGIVTCAAAVDAYGRVLAVDVGSYGGAAAVVLVTAYPANSQYEEVWVVGPRCGPADPAVMRHMVFDVDHSTATL